MANFIYLTGRTLSALAAGMLVAVTAHAGRSCEEKKPTVQTIERGMSLAEQTMRALDASGHQVVLLARAGQDLSRYNLRYSHLGIAYKQPTGNGGHVWRVLHKLNQCGTSVAAIYRQGLGEFFLDDLWRFEAAYAAPSAAAQEKILAVLQNDWHATRLHHRPYSIVSYAWGGMYQQSNQWAIETMAMALAPSVDSRMQAQEWLSRSGYRPTTLKIGPLMRLGGRMTAANVAFYDHPPDKRFSDRIETVTVDSVFAWLAQTGIAEKPVAVRLR
ncbi:DUF2145 domain-containing protein [Janthinobacterium sp. 17J80-10]|uniref:DUF2145 domain-containing protein n=1 Tax=Janthinobacterium sp. 17J80-10 TaxID=2497863 RepID=UPI00100586E6|nr:DUF2145 domain-containing protein [Janthinobacterium sp. 17J80-10]QAU33086.1 DUF2145 domain-containing protein [Janthinobacterium sp. 17J80-10]